MLKITVNDDEMDNMGNEVSFEFRVSGFEKRRVIFPRNPKLETRNFSNPSP